MSITTRREASLSYWGPGSVYSLQSGILVCTSYPIVWEWGAEVYNDNLKDLIGYPNNPLKLALKIICTVFPNQWYCPRCKTLVENKTFTGWQSLQNSPTCPQPDHICPKGKGNKKAGLIPLRVLLACSEGHVSRLPIKDQLKKKLGLEDIQGRVKILPSRSGSWAMSLVWLQGEDGKESEKFKLVDLMRGIQCPGETPWLGMDDNGGVKRANCDLRLEDAPRQNPDPDTPTPQLKMLVVGDSALYNPLRTSVIKRGETLKEMFWKSNQRTIRRTLRSSEDENVLEDLRDDWADFLKDKYRVSDITVDDAFVRETRAYFEAGETSGKTMEDIKREEVSYLHDVARHRDDTQPVVTSPLSGHDLDKWISTVLKVEKVSLTGAFVGFSRVGRKFDTDIKTEARRFYGVDYNMPIPVSESIGEGVYLELNPETLKGWVHSCGKDWTARFPMRTDQSKPDPRYVLVHTISHALMMRFAMLCGYPLVSLNERIYCDTATDGGRVGVLIYTTGDSMGSLGGLAGMMDSPESFRELFIDAIRETSWCSSDPVCLDVHGGACYSCLHLPEMACENFNRALDRGTLWGLPGQEGSGYFKDLEG